MFCKVQVVLISLPPEHNGHGIKPFSLQHVQRRARISRFILCLRLFLLPPQEKQFINRFQPQFWQSFMALQR